jgi:hypothetical protein
MSQSKKLSEMDPESPEYWDQVLHDHHLGMDRGRRKWLSYGHEYFEADSNNEQLPEESE